MWVEVLLMNDKTTNPSSMAKIMKWIPIILGLVSFLLGVVALLVKMENEEAKYQMLLFAAFGLFGLLLMVLGMGFSSVFETLGRLEEKSSCDEDEEEDLRHIG